MKHFLISAALKAEFRDEGPWRSYVLNAVGTDRTTLHENAYITEIDQDGGDLRTYHLDDASRAVYSESVKMITEVFKLGQEKSA